MEYRDAVGKHETIGVDDRVKRGLHRSLRVRWCMPQVRKVGALCTGLLAVSANSGFEEDRMERSPRGLRVVFICVRQRETEQCRKQLRV